MISKFILLFLFLSVLFILNGCKSLFPSMLTMDDKDFKAGIHSVLLLPVYVDNELIPSSAKNFDADYRKSFYEMINSKNDLISSIVSDLLTNGKYKLKVNMDEKINLSAFVQKKTYSMVGNQCNIIFDDNKRYSLSPDTVNSLLNQYKVDAILFHYLQANKVWHLYNWNTTEGTGNQEKTTYYSVNVPELCLQYKALLYVKDGKNIYDDYKQILEVSKNIKDCEKYEPVLDVYEDGAGIIVQLEEAVYGGKRTYYAKQIMFNNLELNKMDDKSISFLFHKKLSMYLKDLYTNN
jgi:hypothetical protein